MYGRGLGCSGCERRKCMAGLRRRPRPSLVCPPPRNRGIRALADKMDSLKARSEAEAKSETDVLNLKLDKAFFEKRKQSGVNRTAHYGNWSRSHGDLRRAIIQLARL